MSVRLVVKPATTVTFTTALVRTSALSSVTTARNACAPAGTLAHAKVNGLVVSSPSFVGPSKNSTLKTAPSGSVASAVRFTVEVATKTAPVAGLVNVTLGGRFDVTGG